MKFNILLEELLNEISPEEIQKKYYSDIEPSVFLRIVSAEPKSKITNGKVLKIGRYSKVLLNMFRKGSLKLEDLPRAKEYLGYLYTYNIPMPEGVNELSDLYDIVKGKMAQSTKSLSVILPMLNDNEYKKVHDGKNWLIFVPKNQKAASYLGVNTDWCTTWGHLSLNPAHKDRSNHFNTHNVRGPLYIIINKSNESNKYQFHFESDQYMDPSDKRINTVIFLEQNPELEQYFFPSLFSNDASTNDVEKELTRSKIISKEKSDILFEKYISTNFSDDISTNPLAKFIISTSPSSGNEKEDYLKHIDSNNLVDLVFGDSEITFEVRKPSNSMDGVDDTIRGFEYSKESSWEYVNENLSGVDWAEELDSYLEEYYSKNIDNLKSKFGSAAANFNTFEESYGFQLYENDTVKDKYTEFYTDATASNYEGAMQSEIDEIKRYISFGGNWGTKDVHLNKFDFVLFLLKTNVTNINDEEGIDLNTVIDNYIEHYRIPTEIWDYPEYEWVYPSVEQMLPHIDNFFDELSENLNSDDGSECQKKKIELKNILEKNFKFFTSLWVFENENVLLKIGNPWIKRFDCEKGVSVNFTNKDKNETHTGYVKIENLMSYATNYPLFENAIKIKKLLD
jgi:hypothetical protein